MALLVLLTWGGLTRAQEPPAPPPQLPSGPLSFQNTGAATCVEPPPMVRLQDYNGPLKKTVGTFARKLERKSVHQPHYKPGAVLCSLQPKDKFVLFVQDTLDPVTFLGSAFNAGLEQGEDQDPTFGQGAAGYGKRFGADFADQASSKFFKDFAYPLIFSEDPRYYRLGQGSTGKRLLHSVEHAFVAHRDTGRRMFNFSEWLGTTSGVVLGNLYHPGNARGIAPAARSVCYNILEDIGFDMLREFWPEISRKFKLPFRGEHEPMNHNSNPTPSKPNNN
ncbi:MAG TPA: hypothetical protein VKE24_05900 [Candidatus Acidoferrales bacterium]|nr:hypothetical protein [Candidatus Acidoferrales bacterium]